MTYHYTWVFIFVSFTAHIMNMIYAAIFLVLSPSFRLLISYICYIRCVYASNISAMRNDQVVLTKFGLKQCVKFLVVLVVMDATLAVVGSWWML